MEPRPGFARLLPLMALTGLAAGTIVLLVSARPVQAPQRNNESIGRVGSPGAVHPWKEQGCRSS